MTIEVCKLLAVTVDKLHSHFSYKKERSKRWIFLVSRVEFYMNFWLIFIDYRKTHYHLKTSEKHGEWLSYTQKIFYIHVRVLSVSHKLYIFSSSDIWGVYNQISCFPKIKKLSKKDHFIYKIMFTCVNLYQFIALIKEIMTNFKFGIQVFGTIVNFLYLLSLHTF